MHDKTLDMMFIAIFVVNGMVILAVAALTPLTSAERMMAGFFGGSSLAIGALRVFLRCAAARRRAPVCEEILAGKNG